MASVAKKFGVAIVGLGRMGSIHLKTLMLSQRAKVKWVMRNDLNAAKSLANSYDAPPQCITPSQYDLVLGDKSVDAVVICSLTSQHEDQIRLALDAGKAVFSEKPITPELDSTRACYDLAENKKLPLLCAFHRRFDPSFMAVKANLKEQTSGRLRLLRSSSHDENAPPISYVRKSGGIFKDSTIHDLDMVLWLSGSPPKTVFVQGHAFNEDIGKCGDLDLAVISIRHQNGTISVIDNGRRCAHGYDQRLEAICEDGSYFVTNRATNQVFQHTTASSTIPQIDKVFDTRYTDAYVNEIEHFLDVLEGKPLRVTKADTLAAMQLADAATVSARTGQPVDLSLG